MIKTIIFFISLSFNSYALELNHNIDCVISASYRTVINLNGLDQNSQFEVNKLSSEPFIEIKSSQFGLIPLYKNELLESNLQKITFQKDLILIETIFEIPSCKIRSFNRSNF